MTSQREAYVQHEILLAWGAHPLLRIARINTGKAKLGERWVTFGVPGTADIVGLIKPTGRLLMIECKSATGKLREAQKTMQRVVTEFGGLWITARSLADVDYALEAIGIAR